MRPALRQAAIFAALVTSLLVAVAAWAGHATTGSSAHARVATVDIRERDFHITAPQQVTAGTVQLRVSNLGPDMHQLIVVRKGRSELALRADGLTVNEEALKPATAGYLEPGQPGSVRTLRVHLRPGRYVLLCNMAGHYLGGMDSDLVVR